MQCPSIYVDNDFPKVHMLMYADDICIVNDSVGRLQMQINVLGSFCSENGLMVNLAKTKIVVFRHGGPLRRNEVFFYKNVQLECVSTYINI